MNAFTYILKQNLKAFRSVCEDITGNLYPLGITGLSPVHKAHFAGAVCEQTGKRAIIITRDSASALKLVSDLNTMYSSAVFFPEKDIRFGDFESRSGEYEQQRIGVLSKILEGKVNFVVTSAAGALSLTLPAQKLRENTLTISEGTQISPEALAQRLLGAGYTNADLVEGIGQFSVRGGIFDIYSPAHDEPLRLEFWGDEIDTVSYFSTEDQRRTNRVSTADIYPVKETLFASNEELTQKLKALLKRTRKERPREKLLKDISLLESGAVLRDTDRYFPVAYESPATLFDYLPDGLLFVAESLDVKNGAKAAEGLYKAELKGAFESGLLSKGLDRYALTLSELFSVYESFPTIYLDNFTRGSFDTPVKDYYNVTAASHSLWDGSLAALTDEIYPLTQTGKTAVLAAGTQKNAKALFNDLQSNAVRCIYYEKIPEKFTPGAVNIICGTLSASYTFPEAGFALVSEGRNKQKTGKVYRKKRKKAEIINSLEEIHPGDYIVHSVHGIGIFAGVVPLQQGNVTKDYIKITYAKGDTLYVPVTQLDLVSKYIGGGENPRVKINSLGGKEWQKARTRAKANARNMAKELIDLYSKRMKIKGYAFREDDELQSDFEAHFPYVETDDQLRCCEEIKRDMCSPHPMDRLLCGDVGFGKTEVALRAAFKCISEGKQCAMLVPTTILAYQHFSTVCSRMDRFPLNIEMLSRFRSAAQQKVIKKKLKNGALDMVIGTHRIISKDVEFKDLGLLIIDEEQRFGVAQKERLKERFPNVDVLTLSATPIPRTLNMAMSGIRDMSVIEEAPTDRHPIQTYVMEYNLEYLCEAMKKELHRGGQCYYLHNRVDDIELTASVLHSKLPGARIGIAHGKMSEGQLSEIWRKLMENEIDILVCTTIIETGVDVPNVNTLIIENADRMGLAQLHQIRGRVGRSSRRATAYFTYRQESTLSDAAYNRLEAIREYTQFGSGFKIAMRDLEIRGAGDILGSQQHGQIEAVGYDMYVKLLSQAVSEEKGEAENVSDRECLIDLPIDAHIPESYISNLPQRLAAYRRIAEVRTQSDASDVYDELIDRYGDIPKMVEGLIEISLLRNTAISLGFTEIKGTPESVRLYADSFDLEKVSRLDRLMPGKVRLNAAEKPYLTVKVTPEIPAAKVIKQVFAILGNAIDDTQ